MKRLLAALLLVAAPALAQSNGWREAANGWGEIQAASGGVPVGCVASSVPIFLGSPVAMGCDAGLTYDAATDTLTTGRVLVGDGSVAAPSVGFASDPAAGLYVAYPGAIGMSLGAGIGNAFNFKGSATAPVFSMPGDGAEVRFGAAADLRLSRPSAGTLQLGKAPNATPVANTLIVGESGSGTDIAGANGTVYSGVGTGTGAASSLILRSPVPQTTGSTAQPLATVATVTNAGTAGVSLPRFSLASTAQLAWSTDLIMTRKAAASWQFGAADVNTGAVAQTINFQSNITGSNLASPGAATFKAPAGTGTGAAGSFDFQVGTVQGSGTTAHAMASVVTIKNGGTAGTALPQVQVASTGQLGFSTDVIMTRNAAGVLQHGAADAAAPVAQTIRAQSVVTGTSNTAGAALTIQGSTSTGLGIAGPVNIKTSAAGLTGTTVNAAVTRRGTGWSKVLTNNSPVTIVNVANASNTSAAGTINYAVEVWNGTDTQIEVGEVAYMISNKGGVWSGNTCLKHGNQQNMTSGTLTVTFAISGANPALLSVNANSSLTPSTGYPRICYNIENLAPANDITMQ